MLLGRNRIGWAVIALLLVICALTIRPVRSWLDQVATRSLVDSKLEVAELHFHPKYSVVEARQINWGDYQGDRAFGISAKRAWIAVEPEPLLDRRFEVPKVILEDARIYLDKHQRNATPVQASRWQQKLALQLKSLDWEQIKENFDSVLALERLQTEWGPRIQNWLGESEKVGRQASKLLENTSDLNNPLRIADQIIDDQNQLKELSKAHDKINERFEGIEAMFVAEEKRLRERFEREATQLDKLVNRNQNDQQLLGMIAEESLTESVTNWWNSISSFAEVSDRISRLPLTKATSKLDMQLRDPSHVNPLVELSELKANGFFAIGFTQVATQVTASYRMDQIDYLPNRSSTATFRFNRASTPLQVASIDGETSGTRVIELIAYDRHQTVESQDSEPQLVLLSDGTTLEGTLTLDLRVLQDFVDTPNLVIQTLEKKLLDDEIELLTFDVSGTWAECKLTLRSELPDSLREAASGIVSEEFASAKERAESELDQRFKEQLASLKSFIEKKVTAGRRQAVVQQSSIEDAIELLAKRQEEHTERHFARQYSTNSPDVR